MLRSTTPFLLRITFPLFLLAAWAGPVIAQSTPKVEKILKPASPPVGKAETPWLPLILGVLVTGIIVGVNFIPSKRGHLD